MGAATIAYSRQLANEVSKHTASDHHQSPSPSEGGRFVTSGIGSTQTQLANDEASSGFGISRHRSIMG